MEQIFGKGVSKGAAAGPISFYRRPSGEIPRRSVTDTAAELARFHDACETVQLDKSLILGFITAGGSANSHTAILARTMGIPAIIGATTLAPLEL